jgi:hypothetical protein
MKSPLPFSYAAAFSIIGPALLLLFQPANGQQPSLADTTVREAVEQALSRDPADPGLQLIQSQQFQKAENFLNNSLKENDLNPNAYFQRGVVNWQQSDTLAACRDWSSVLALGDTATYLLLTKNCGGNVHIGDEVMPVKTFRQALVTRPEAGLSASEADRQAVRYVDQMPVFPGGTEGLFHYLKQHLNTAAIRDASAGTLAYVEFIIDRRGNVLYPHVVRGGSKELNREAVRVIRQMPNWKPGMKNGKPVLVRYTLPVRLHLR